MSAAPLIKMLRRNRHRDQNSGHKKVEGPQKSMHITRGDIGSKFQDTCRIVFLGAAGVGKTNIISQFLGLGYQDEHVLTVEDMYHGYYEIDGARVKLDILDTTGSYQFPAMRRLAINTADAFVLVYAVDDENSYEETKALRKQILVEREAESVSPAIVFVGNKSDLSLTGKRKVPQETASMTAIDWGNGHVETSARENRNIADVFKEIFMQPYFLFLRRRKNRRSSSNALLSLLHLNNTMSDLIGAGDPAKHLQSAEKMKAHTRKPAVEKTNNMANLSPMLNVRKFRNDPSKHDPKKEQADGKEGEEMKNSHRYQTRRMGFSSSANAH